MRKITFKLLTKLPTKYVTTGILLIILLFAYGIIGSHFIMGLNLIDSIYYSVVTTNCLTKQNLYGIRQSDSLCLLKFTETISGLTETCFRI